jgi:hypothetical protein
MATVSHRHRCGNCGNFLGIETVPVIGVTPNFNENTGEVIDPDCPACNPYYDDHCKKCHEQTIDPTGKCKSCGCVHAKKR